MLKENVWESGSILLYAWHALALCKGVHLILEGRIAGKLQCPHQCMGSSRILTNLLAMWPGQGCDPGRGITQALKGFYTRLSALTSWNSYWLLKGGHIFMLHWALKIMLFSTPKIFLKFFVQHTHTHILVHSHKHVRAHTQNKIKRLTRSEEVIMEGFF